MKRTPRLFTIGYEKARSPDVLAELKDAGVELLIDVRAVAASRRPGFSKRQLAASLDESGIGYVHLRGLGTPAEGRAAARKGKLDDLFAIYQAHLATAQAREELDALTGIISKGQRSCLLCYERDPECCHRKWIAEVMHARTGVRVENLAAKLL